jgi:hypothetical protein
MTFEDFLNTHYGFVPYPEDTLLVAKTKLLLMRYASSMTQVPDMWGLEILAIRDYLFFLETELGLESDWSCFKEDRRLGIVGRILPESLTNLFESTRTVNSRPGQLLHRLGKWLRGERSA